MFSAAYYVRICIPGPQPKGASGFGPSILIEHMDGRSSFSTTDGGTWIAERLVPTKYTRTESATDVVEPPTSTQPA